MVPWWKEQQLTGTQQANVGTWSRNGNSATCHPNAFNKISTDKCSSHGMSELNNFGCLLAVPCSFHNDLRGFDQLLHDFKVFVPDTHYSGGPPGVAVTPHTITAHSLRRRVISLSRAYHKRTGTICNPVAWYTGWCWHVFGIWWLRNAERLFITLHFLFQ